VESEKDWHEVLLTLGKDKPNLDFQLHTIRNSYLEALNSLRPNIVIVDGLYRSDCATQILNLDSSELGELELVIFDNSNWFPAAISRLTNGLVEFQRIDFSGMGPIVAFPTTTSLFLRRRNSKMRLKDQQILPTGAPKFTHPEDF
jgi:hypothetical protein